VSRTVVQYGEIILYNVTTRRWSQEVTYDETGTDVIGARFSLAFDGLIHAQRVPITDSITFVSSGTGNLGSAVAAYDSIRRQLNEPRQTLTVLNGNEPMLVVTPSTTDVLGITTDIDNGPKPRRVEITSVVSNAAFRVRFEIDAMVGSCPVSKNSVVVSNRWSVAEAMDSNFCTTRNIDGTLRLAISREVTDTFPVGHQFKGLVFPHLETGFRREAMTFTSDADGLHCRYNVVDKQVDHSAPWPATDMQVQHTEGTSDGIKFGSNVQVQLKGPPYVDKRLLIERAIQIADSRLQFLEQSSKPTQVIMKADITDFIGAEAMIVLNIQTLHLSDSPRALLTHLRINTLGSPLQLGEAIAEGEEIPGTEYDRSISPLPRLYGYSPEGERRPGVLVALHAYLKGNVCVPDGYVTGVTHDEDTKEESRERPTEVAEVPEGSIPESTEDDRYRDEAKNALYTISKITSQYVSRDMKVAMPFSKIFPLRNNNSPTNVVFDLCEPQTMRRIDIDMERVGELPQIPTPFQTIVDGTIIATRLSKDETIYPPVLTADGRFEVFRIEATFWYSLSRPPQPNELLRIGSHHFATGLTNGITQNQIYEDQLA
jgi:hypothetical protein